MKTVLVIDDEASIRGNLARFLRLEGYAVLEAVDGLAGLALVRQVPPPDLVFCDIMMPHLNGFGVLEQMQADPVLRRIPLVFLSASAEPEKLQEGLRMGAHGYVTKPFNLVALRRLLLDTLPDTEGPQP